MSAESSPHLARSAKRLAHETIQDLNTIAVVIGCNKRDNNFRQPISSRSAQLCLTLLLDGFACLADTPTPIILGVTSEIAFIESNQNNGIAGPPR